MIPTWVQAKEGLRHHSHCLQDQCLQLRWGQQLEFLHFLEPLWKQAHESLGGARGCQVVRQKLA